MTQSSCSANTQPGAGEVQHPSLESSQIGCRLDMCKSNNSMAPTGYFVQIHVLTGAMIEVLCDGSVILADRCGEAPDRVAKTNWWSES